MNNYILRFMLKSPFLFHSPDTFFRSFIWKKCIRAAHTSSFPTLFVFSDLTIKLYFNVSVHHLKPSTPLEPFPSPLPFFYPISTRNNRPIITIHIVIMILVYQFIVFQRDIFTIKYLEFVVINKGVFTIA